MKDIMLDIETLGTSNQAVITQIGACYFERLSGKIGEQFCINIRIQDCLDKGLKVDGGAIKFWFGQENKSFLKEPIDLTKAIEIFRQFCNKRALIWSHATFDFIILMNAYKVCGSRPPVSYRNARDIRTLVDLAEIKYKRKKNDEKTHNALEDCLYQVQYCCEAFRKLEKLKEKINE